MLVLAGDIGGTKVLLQLARLDGGARRLLAEQRYESAKYSGLAPIVREFLQTAAVTPNAACFAIAGPIAPSSGGAQVARVTNLPWVVDSAALAADLAISQVRLINDFQAVGYGIEALAPEEFVTLQSGEDRRGAPRALIGAGTGLGQALLVWQGTHYESVATEGGHVDFAPTDAVQIELLTYLHARYGRASYERILSGPGIINLYSFFSARASRPADADLLRAEDPAAAISEAALRRGDPAAVAAMQMFVAVYGAQAGNVALSYLAAGGVYIAGGIAPKILPLLREPPFLQAFSGKGRMSGLLEKFPVTVITNTRVGLIGAATVAARLK
jgi:glucokinase